MENLTADKQSCILEAYGEMYALGSSFYMCM